MDRLAPCTCYDFRLKRTNTDWVHFKAATEDLGPYTSVIHITRAVKMGKTSVIRKIAQLRHLFSTFSHSGMDVRQKLQFQTLVAQCRKQRAQDSNIPSYRGERSASSAVINYIRS